MWKRLEVRCGRVGITCRRNPNPNSSIDGWIGTYAVQLKFRSFPVDKGTTFKVPLRQYAGVIRGTEVKKPYAATDPFDFIIAEFGGTKAEPTKYQGQFCVLPKQVLVDRGVFSSATQPGQTSVGVAPPDYPRKHWTLEHWKTFDQHFAGAAQA
jgi:hypothetical protein